MTRIEELEQRLADLRARHQDCQRMVAAQLQNLLDVACAWGVVVTCGTAPEQPPAMGRYKLRGEVRMHRREYQEVFELEKAIEAEREVMQRMGGDYDHP